MTAEPPDAGRPQRPRLVAAIVAVAFFMQMLDGTIIATSLPAMAADFATDVVSLNLGFTAYLLAMAVFIPPAGWLAERLGARAVFLGAVALFTLASLACALAADLPGFVIARAVQGIGGALMTPVGRQIVLRHAPKSELVRAIALITWPSLIAPVVGPVLGGWITSHAGWRWNFLLNLPIGLAGLLLALAFVPREARPAPRRFDAVGFVLTAGALSALLIGLELVSHGGGGPSAALAAAGLALAAAALRHLRRAAHPLVSLEVLRVPTFALSTLGPGTASRAAINAAPFLLPLLFQVGFGLGAVETGSLLLVYFLGNLAMKPATTGALRRFGFRTLLVANGLLAAASLAAFAAVDAGTPRPFLYALLFAAGLTRSMQFTALNTIAFADVEASQRSAATTLSSMTQQLSQLLAVAGAALLVRAALLAEGGADPSAMLFAIRVALVCVGGLGILAALRFRTLRRDAGDEVSGRAVTATVGGGR